MKRRIAGLLLCLAMAAGAFSGTAAASQDWSVSSATWQDPNNVVLMWQAQEGYTYQVYRSDSPDGTYTMIGTSASGSYRDGEAEWTSADGAQSVSKDGISTAWPQNIYYKVQAVAPNGALGALSQPIRAGTNPHKLSKVTVLMYHNFISAQDIANGVEFEEYSLDPADFRADLQYFRDNGYTTITSADLLDYINGEKPLPAKALILSIDDGTLGVYTNAWPLLKEYRMKADFNLIGEWIDESWELVHDGGTRLGLSAPYCEWNELIEMSSSGEINLCSHTYGLHRYNRDGRIGSSIMEGEPLEDFIQVVKDDYDLSVSCIGGWTGTPPTTMAYPYSRRSTESDAAILENTGYEILMGGEGARGTASNYFVDGASPESQMRIMSRPCRMDGHPAQEYLEAVDREDQSNGVNTAENTMDMTPAESAEIALWYSPYADVPGDASYAGAVYYTYVNSLMDGTSLTQFSPDAAATRAAASEALYALAGKPAASGTLPGDVPSNASYAQAARWMAENRILPGLESGGALLPAQAVTREDMASALYRLAQLTGRDTSARSQSAFADSSSVSPAASEAVLWAAAEGILSPDAQGNINSQAPLTRAQLAVILQAY